MKWNLSLAAEINIVESSSFGFGVLPENFIYYFINLFEMHCVFDRITWLRRSHLQSYDLLLPKNIAAQHT